MTLGVNPWDIYHNGAWYNRDGSGGPLPIGDYDSHAAEHAAMGGIVRVIEHSAVAASVTGTVAETTLATIAVPAMGANDAVRVTAKFSFTSSTNLKTMYLKLNGSVFGQTSTSTSGHTVAAVLAMVENRNSTSSQLGTFFGLGLSAATSGSYLSPSVDTSGANTITIRATLANTGETITLESYTVELIRNP